jgi:hypothetical protein
MWDVGPFTFITFACSIRFCAHNHYLKMQRFARAAIPFAKTVSMVQPKFTTSATRYLATIRFAASHEYVSVSEKQLSTALCTYECGMQFAA